jgi:hypothetical protein
VVFKNKDVTQKFKCVGRPSFAAVLYKDCIVIFRDLTAQLPIVEEL